ncbi:MAG: SDR family oxidoreductase [Candidatus Hydrogenedentes bacterium]|nr:SDR family oxidoreductase [Candidatus Hydrogenedentota bacterium]
MLKGKTILVTGAGRGIGRGIAVAFAARGCAVVAAARTKSEVDETVKLVEDAGVPALGVVCDVTDATQVRAMVDSALKQFGAIDILVNNAGYACFKPFTELTPEEWQRTLDVNLTAPFYCTQAVLPSMMARRSGRIINISSVAGLKPILNQSAYCASKFGLNGLTRTLALELRAYGIGVHSICPGGVDTRLAQEAMPDRDKTDWMTPEDIAETCIYLASLSPRAAVDEIMIRRFDSVPLGG